MHLSKTQLAVLSLIIANLIWGAAPPIFKWSMQDIQPFTLAFLRFALAALILYPFIHKKLKIHNEDIPILLFISIIGCTFHIAYYYVGLTLSSSINVPMIASAAPIFLVIGSTIFFHEKLKKKIVQGTLISLVGVILIILQPMLENGMDSSMIGNILFTVSMGLSVFYTLMIKEIAPKYNPLTLTFWIFTISSISFLPLVMLEAGNSHQLFNFDIKSIIGILFGAILCSIVAYTLQAYAIKYISTNEVAMFSYVDPIIAIMIAKPLLGETINSTFIYGSLLIFLGIFIAEGRLHYHPFHLLRPKPLPAGQNINIPDNQKTNTP